MILVTAYETPDLDGSACAFAYAELLRRQDKEAQVGFIGVPHREARFVFDYLRISPPILNKVNRSNEIILTDSSEVAAVHKTIKLDQIIEVIDHRKSNEGEKFTNAKVQIELVGACATLIAEKFIQRKIKPSRESAILLYLAIVSNTINFKNRVTTMRDKKAAHYLKSIYKIDQSLVRQTFLHKSDIADKTIKELFVEDAFVNSYNNQRFTIYQIEIIGVNKFVKENLDEIIMELNKVQIAEKAVIIFLSCIDLLKSENTFICSDKKTQVFLERAYGVKFISSIAKHKGIIMRKEIVPEVKKYLNN